MQSYISEPNETSSIESEAVRKIKEIFPPLMGYIFSFWINENNSISSDWPTVNLLKKIRRIKCPREENKKSKVSKAQRFKSYSPHTPYMRSPMKNDDIPITIIVNTCYLTDSIISYRPTRSKGIVGRVLRSESRFFFSEE